MAMIALDQLSIMACKIENSDISRLPTTRAEAKRVGSKLYFTGVPCKHGHLAPHRTNGAWCVTCDRLTKRPGPGGTRTVTPEKRSQYNQTRRLNSPERVLLRNAKGRARDRGIFLSLSLTDITIPDACPCCNLPFSVSGRRADRAPSIDRFDNQLGYIPSNINIICWECNRTKGSATLDRLKFVVAWIETKLAAA